MGMEENDDLPHLGMNQSSPYLTELMQKIRAIQLSGDNGWHESKRAGDTGIGKTFEDLLEKKEDNICEADFHDIEIKTRRKLSTSLLTLFTKSPTEPRGVNTKLRRTYGYGHPQQLHVTVPSTKPAYNTSSQHAFQIHVDHKNKYLQLLIFNEQNQVIDNTAVWSFSSIEKILKKKMKTTIIVSADEKKENGKTYFKYNAVDIMTGLTLDGFLRAIEDDAIVVDIRLGVYKTGKRKGSTHDHGTAFRIPSKKLLKYAKVERLIL